MHLLRAAPAIRLVLPALCSIAGLTITEGSIAADKPRASQKVARGLEVLVTADAIDSPEGFRPKPGKPIHYLFQQTRQSLGDAVAGIKLPAPELVETAVVKELDKQGFVRAQLGGPIPQIVILAVVGDANFTEPPIDRDRPLDDPAFRPFMDMVNFRALLQKNMIPSEVGRSLEELWDPNRSRSMDRESAQELVVAEAIRIREQGSGRAVDRSKITALVGVKKAVRAMHENGLGLTEADRIARAAWEDRYYITLSAFDVEGWRNKERVLLWRTTILIDARKNFAAELPTMLAHAGPVLGTDMRVPGFFDERTRRKAEVEIGELKVMTEKDVESSPALDGRK